MTDRGTGADAAPPSSADADAPFGADAARPSSAHAGAPSGANAAAPSRPDAATPSDTAPATLSATTIDPGWARALAPVEPRIVELSRSIAAERAAGRTILPAADHVLRAFSRPFDDVRVLILGQDPYPTPGHPIGLSFAVDADVRPLPRSLGNIFRELHDDLGIAIPEHGDLSAWADHGVLLLNRVLTVEAGAPRSHRGRGWEAVTEQAIRALVARDAPLVAILWGKDAASLRPLLGATPIIESAHPSPLSARRGFVGSRPFSRANAALVAQGAAPVDWTLPTA